MLARYAAQAGITRSMSPHKWRHFLFTWLKKEGIDDALIQPYSGHATRQSLEIYSRLSLADAQPSLQCGDGTLSNPMTSGRVRSGSGREHAPSAFVFEVSPI
jgi:integrase-like protein